MEDFNIKSDVALAWTAGFFCGEGTITIGGRTDQYECWNFSGIVSMSQQDCIPLNIIHSILEAYGVSTPVPHYYESEHAYRLSYSQTKGSAFLRLIIPYPMHKKHRRRAKVYLRMWPPGESHIKRPAERKKIYAEWLQLRIEEL